jgi:hypothetical protein
MQQTMYQQPAAQQPSTVQQSYGAGIYTSNTNQMGQLPVQQTGYNPFFTNQQQPQQPQLSQQSQQLLAVNTATLPGAYANNPFARSPTRIQSPTLTQIPEQTQQNFYNPSPQSAPEPEWFAQPQQQAYQQHSYQQPQPVQQQSGYQQPQPLQPQHTNNPFATPVQCPQPTGQPRPDKAAILALYNYPQLAPQSQQQQQQQQQLQEPQQQQQQPQAAAPQASQAQSAFDQMFGQSYTTQHNQQPAASPAPAPANLAATSNNPFMTASPSVQTKSNKSRDSMMAFGMEWSNGRHSPDAFASLSARHR